MDCWQREIKRSTTEAQVVACAADFMALWSPREFAPAMDGRALRIENADDLQRVKKWLVEDLGGGVSMGPVQPLRELGDYFWHAAERLREIRSS